MQSCRTAALGCPNLAFRSEPPPRSHLTEHNKALLHKALEVILVKPPAYHSTARHSVPNNGTWASCGQCQFQALLGPVANTVQTHPITSHMYAISMQLSWGTCARAPCALPPAPARDFASLTPSAAATCLLACHSPIPCGVQHLTRLFVDHRPVHCDVVVVGQHLNQYEAYA
jgi:hypothetical protein